MSLTLHGRDDLRKRWSNASEEREPSLVRLYSELTGASESAARSVFMHVCCGNEGNKGQTNEYGIDTVQSEEPAWRWLPRADSDRGEDLATGAAIPVPA